MGSLIKLRTVSAVADKRIALSNSNFVRAIPFGTSWTKIRIGVRWDQVSSGGNLTGTPRFALGVCSGNTNIYGDATTTHFVGIRSNEATWTITGSNRYLVNGSTIQPHKKVVSTITTGTAFFPAVQWGIGAGAGSASADRTVCFLEILKGNPNFTLQCLGWINTGAAPSDVSLTTFLSQMEVSGTPAVAEHTFSATQTLAVSESDGNLDNINIYWDRTTANIEISDLAIARLS